MAFWIVYFVFAGICYLIIKADILSDGGEEKLRGLWQWLLGPASVLLLFFIWYSVSTDIGKLSDKIDKLNSAENEGELETGEKKEASE